MITQALEILEFNALRALVSRGAQTAAGRDCVDQLLPLDDLVDLQRDLQLLAEMIELRRRGVRLSFADLVDPTDSISRLQIEGTALEPLAILGLAGVFGGAMGARGGRRGEG